MRDLVALDFFTVPTAGLRVLFVLIMLTHDRRRVVHFNVTGHPTAHWTAQAERLIGSVRRECLNHVIVLGERHLRRVLTAYLAYYHRARTHLSLDKDAPDGRPIEPPELGAIIPIPEVSGLYHRYVRRAA